MLNVLQRKHRCTVRCGSLHLVEHVGERRFEPQGLFDLVGGDVGVLSILQETRALVLTNELHEGVWILFPVLWESLEVGEHRGDPGRAEQRHRILGVLVEIGVEDALVLKIKPRTDAEQYTPKVVQPQRREHVGTPGNRFFDLLAVRADGLFAPLFDLRDDRKAIAGRSSRIDRTVAAPLELKVPLLRNGRRRWLAPVGVASRHHRTPVYASVPNTTPRSRLPGPFRRRPFDQATTVASVFIGEAPSVHPCQSSVPRTALREPTAS